MNPFRRPGFPKKPVLEDDGMDYRLTSYGMSSTEFEPEEISLGVDTSTLLDLIEKGEV